MSDSRKFTKSSESKRVDESKLCDKLSQSASSTVSFLEAKLQKDGSYGADAKDIACYFKSPMMFLAANKPLSASLILGHIKCSFMSKDGDFKTTNGLKSANAAYIEYWSYINGWIVRAAHQPNQLHFMVGYPAAYLAMLYKKTNNPEYLKTSQEYLDFSLSCEKSVYTCDFSHKIAWAASILYECTGNTKYLAVIEKIADHFIKNQKNGMWFSDDIVASYDQSAEIACWFLEIVKNVSCLKKKEALTDVSPVTHKMSTMNK